MARHTYSCSRVFVDNVLALYVLYDIYMCLCVCVCVCVCDDLLLSTTIRMERNSDGECSQSFLVELGSKRRRLLPAVFNQVLLSLVVQFLTKAELCKTIRRTCTGWAKMQFNFHTLYLNQFNSEAVIKATAPASVKELHLISMKYDSLETRQALLNSLVNLETLYIANFTNLDFSRLHHLKHIHAPTGYSLSPLPESLETLFTPDPLCWKLKTAPNLTHVLGFFAVNQHQPETLQITCPNLVCAEVFLNFSEKPYNKPYKAKDFALLNTINAYYRLHLCISATNLVQVEFSGNFVASLVKLEIYGCENDIGKILQQLAALPHLRYLTTNFLDGSEGFSTPGAWKALEVLTVDDHVNMEFFASFVAAHLMKTLVLKHSQRGEDFLRTQPITLKQVENLVLLDWFWLPSQLQLPNVTQCVIKAEELSSTNRLFEDNPFAWRKLQHVLFDLRVIQFADVKTFLEKNSDLLFVAIGGDCELGRSTFQIDFKGELVLQRFYNEQSGTITILDYVMWRKLWVLRQHNIRCPLSEMTNECLRKFSVYLTFE